MEDCQSLVIGNKYKKNMRHKTHAFFPKPKVDSSLLLFWPKKILLKSKTQIT